MNRVATVVASAILALSGSCFAQLAGETPAIQNHLNQTDIEQGRIRFNQLRDLGQTLFEAKFNILDGRGRPFFTGGNAPRETEGPAFLRTSGPDANSCMGCHNEPRSGGGGEFVANVFVLAQTLDPVTDSVAPEFSNERNTLGMMGAGPIEMLAREMTAELHAIRDEARTTAQQTGEIQTRALLAKGVSFGFISVLPDGKIDPTAIEGIDWDLIVKPFHQKGAVVSIREFTNNAMNHHHGMQTVERFGANTDPDGDGVMNELTVGDVTAATIYQAALNTPVQVKPNSPAKRRQVEWGEQLFNDIGCTQCHIPSFTLENRHFVEPNPYNPAGNLRQQDVAALYSFDLTADGEKPRLERGRNGTAIIRPFTDLKRHDICDDELNHFENEQITQGRLNGFAPDSDFTIVAPPRPVEQFLTRKLWDVGNSAPYGHRGDLSTISEAIFWHGGDARAQRDAFLLRTPTEQTAIVEFLKTLQIVPPKNN